ncbi:MAG TPA: thiamine pyrophosphate-binding protein [Solirubrobacteraceae bacterium]
MNGGEVLAQCLARAGVRDVYGVPAGKLSPFMRAIASDPAQLGWTGTRHEAAAAWMAAASFRASGRIAVCCGEGGPGTHNLIAGLGSAYANNVALVAIVSGPPSHLTYPFSGFTMETDGQTAFAAVTKWRALARDPSRIAELVRRALSEALSGRPGPVAIELPADVLAAEVEPPGAGEEFVRPSRPAPDADAIEQAAQLLARAERPLIIAGGGVVAADATSELRAVVGRLGAAATATQMGLGVVSSDSPEFFGHGGLIGGEAVGRALREADVVVAVGSRLSSWWWDATGPAVRAGGEQRLIQIDIDPAMIGRLVSADVPVVGDARTALQMLAEALGEGAPPSPSAWVASLRADYARYRDELRSLSGAPGGLMHPAELAREVGDWLPRDGLAVYDGGHTTFWSNDLTPANEPRTRFHEPGMAHLGFGVPHALALAALFPGRTVVNLTGDGAFGFTLPELDTARRYGLAAIHVIHNNAAWGVIALGQSRHDFELGTDLDGTDYAAIARAFGCHGERVERPEEVRPALERARDSGLPAVIDARVAFVAHPGMKYFASAGTRPR